jgi:DHA2 family multidrug resistance protein
VLVGSSLIVFGLLDPMSEWPMLVLPQITRGAGLALMMAPLMAAALNAVPRHELPMASSFLNVSQNVGGSLGIALLNNFVTNSIHIHAVRLGEVFPVQSQAFDVRLGLRAMPLVFRHEPGPGRPCPDQGRLRRGQGIARKAQVLGFENGFVLAGLILLAAIPLCFLLKPAAHHLEEEEKAGTVAAEFLAD